MSTPAAPKPRPLLDFLPDKLFVQKSLFQGCLCLGLFVCTQVYVQNSGEDFMYAEKFGTSRPRDAVLDGVGSCSEGPEHRGWWQAESSPSQV